MRFRTKSGFTRTNFQRSLGGFTLIELLVVIAIIGILSSVVLASLNTARTKSRDARRLTDIEQIRTALEFYADANSGKYPATTTPLVTGGFIPQVPRDPQSTQTCASFAAGTYCYTGISTDTDAATCESYHLGAKLEDTTANASALAGDRDALAASYTICTGGTAFDGTDPIYDVRP